ncbi:MAG: Asp-tRNA(Asn)/Glu-tRNA(Gln) amidotransferase subunit GatA [Gemmataceae bacterium]
MQLNRTATDLLRALDHGEFSSEELLGEYLAHVRVIDETLGGFLLIDEEEAIAQAKAADAARAKNIPNGKLAGIPVALKDNICVAGQKSTCASKILRNFLPPYDAHVTERLKQAGAVLIGKTNLDEFGMGSSTENSGFQPTRNPWNPECIPGGSSGGSAVIVAAREAPLALGTDTGGSIRQPAALCGVVGLKPTYGLVSRYGLIAFGSSLEQIGPLALSVEDVALLLEVIAGHDDRDSTSANQPTIPYSQTVAQKPKPITIGLPREYFGDGLDKEVEAAVREVVKVYQGLGATVKEVSLPHSKYAIAAYYVVATAEASSNLARYDGVHYGHRAEKFDDLIDMYTRSRSEGFGDEVKRRIMLGTFVLSSGHKDAYYHKAMRVRRLIADDFTQAFSQCDVLLSPTSPTPAFRFGERVDDPLAMYLSDVYTISSNLAGIPTISIPCGFSSSGLPIGVQLMASTFQEEKLLQIAHVYQTVTDWHTRFPAMPSDSNRS